MLSGRRAKRVQLLGGRPFSLPPRCAVYQGYNLHAGVGIGARDRSGLERLCRYVLRPPLARDRLEFTSSGQVLWHLKRAWSDGTTAMRFSPTELVERLASLGPPPRVNTVLYHGLFAPRAKDRDKLLPRPRPRPRRVTTKLAKPEVVSDSSRWMSWAALLHRVFGVDGLACPHCGAAMTLRTLVLSPPQTERVIRGIEASVRRARGPP